MSSHPDTQRHPLDPRFAVEIKTPAQALLWRKILLAKIAAQVILLAGMLLLLGVTWQQLAFVAVFACAWKVFDLWRNGRLSNLLFWRKWNIPS